MSAMAPTLILTLYEPRWHGWARWEIIERTPYEGSTVAICKHIENGWTRRSRGSRAVEAEVTSERWRMYFLTGNPEPIGAANA